MKKIGQVMQELGFRKDAPDSVKEAFIKHLIKASVGVNVSTPSEIIEVKKNPQSVIALPIPEQLSFEFLEHSSSPKDKKKAVS